MKACFFFIFSLSIWISPCLATDLDAKSIISSLPNYSAHPDLEKYYRKSTSSDDQLKKAGQSRLGASKNDLLRGTINRDPNTHQALSLDEQTDLFDKKTIESLEEAQKTKESINQEISANLPRIPKDTNKLKGVCAEKDLTDLEAALGGKDRAIDKDTGEALIFAGKPAECSEGKIGFRNCCREKGWGLDLDLAHCNDQEKSLADARKEGRAFKVGRFCSKHVLGTCKAHHQTWCIFPTKLGAIIQMKGRVEQLGISFGEGKTPNCRGILPVEYKSIDFLKIDLSAAYMETKNNLTPIQNFKENLNETGAVSADQWKSEK